MSLSLKITVESLPEKLETLADDIKNWSEDLARATIAKMQAEIEEERIIAQTNIRIRQNPLDYGLAKPTEDGIKAKILLEQAVIDAKAKTVEATATFLATRAVVDGLDAQRSNVKYMVELISKGFISMSPMGK